MPSRPSSLDSARDECTSNLNPALRPDLYNRLCHPIFADRYGYPVIANEGEAFEFHYERDWSGKLKLVVDTPGEYYRVNCPWCLDTKKRLWINHRFGFRDDRTGSLCLFLAVCYNENCLEESGRVWLLYDELFNQLQFTSDDRGDIIREATKEHVEVKAEMPGVIKKINEPPENHPARLYLKGRGFNVDYLANTFQVGRVVEPKRQFPAAAHRIVIPIFLNGELRGWQCRYPSDNVPEGTPKYYSMPGMKKTKLLYNYDMAKTYPYVVVCEGPTDVWRFGPEAVALLGMKISSDQLSMISQTWKEKKVYIVLDPEAENEAKELDYALRNADLEKIIVCLPKGQDPGSLPSVTLRDMVLAAR